MPIDLDERGQALENQYFHKKEQELIAKMKEKLASEDAKATQMSCPRCDGKLVETAFDEVMIDVCDKCSGVWLDAGELAQVMEKDEKDTGWFGRWFG